MEPGSLDWLDSKVGKVFGVIFALAFFVSILVLAPLFALGVLESDIQSGCYSDKEICPDSDYFYNDDINYHQELYNDYLWERWEILDWIQR